MTRPTDLDTNRHEPDLNDIGSTYERGESGLVSWIGTGAAGGKANGLLRAENALQKHFPDGTFQNITITIPRMTVIRTDVFDAFLKQNNLIEQISEGDSDDAIADLFQEAEIPPSIVGDLMDLVQHCNQPLAVRSSSLLEDSLHEPMAGVYVTKMISNRSPEPTKRFNELTAAIKLVWASLFFAGARSYLQSRKKDVRQEKMAVIIQRVVGRRHEDHFYPLISGVARSWNFYPVGYARPEQGVVDLALGLGKTIVDGGQTWSYSPAYPKAPAPYGSVRDLMHSTQTRFWAVMMGKPPEWNPLTETEYMVQSSIKTAEEHGVLSQLCSTYDPSSDRIYSGLFGRGPRVIDFSPMLQANTLPLNDLILQILHACESECGEKVEIEFALDWSGKLEDPVTFALLQTRPMNISAQMVDIEPLTSRPEDLFIRSEHVLGNGEDESIRDIVFIRPDTFDMARTMDIASEIGDMNRALTDTFYLLLGFGRWGSSDPWLGVPVCWGQISGARAIVEAPWEKGRIEMSQGSHFFHNMTALGVFYFSIWSQEHIDWEWLQQQEIVQQTQWLKHVRLESPIHVAVDGRTGKGVILKP